MLFITTIHSVVFKKGTTLCPLIPVCGGDLWLCLTALASEPRALGGDFCWFCFATSHVSFSDCQSVDSRVIRSFH